MTTGVVATVDRAAGRAPELCESDRGLLRGAGDVAAVACRAERAELACAEPVLDEEPLVSAWATAAPSIADPIPNAIANAPMRPMCVASGVPAALHFAGAIGLREYGGKSVIDMRHPPTIPAVGRIPSAVRKVLPVTASVVASENYQLRARSSRCSSERILAFLFGNLEIFASAI